MSKIITIIDYGMGNLRSVQKGFEKVGYSANVSSNANDIGLSDAVVLPGVGAFKDCMKNLNDLDLIKPIRKFIESGKPFLGICLGLQVLFTDSEEFGAHKGLDVIKGRVRRFPFGKNDSSANERLKVPHMGWNSISFKKKHPMFEKTKEGAYCYFVHSFYVEPDDEDTILTTTNYGIDFVSAISKENVVAVQFHPEKSHEDGLIMLKKFGEMA